MVNTSTAKPVILITMGDPAGIGPEIILKALASGEVYSLCRPVVVGAIAPLQQAVTIVSSPMEFHILQYPHQSKGQPGLLDLIDLHNLPETAIIPGQLSAACGRASVEYILQAYHLLQGGEAAALVTAPINKAATRLAGYLELGHMELLARLSGVRECATMLVSGPLRVVHLTTHYALKEALNYVTREKILSNLRLTWKSLRNWGVQNPRLAVSALNPHGGEGGILGEEEIREIIPAVADARAEGMAVSGPYPADTVFTRALKGEWDAVLALYHDQGHIPIKVFGFETSCSVALGFPFLRTSVDHGTAFDIAGRGIASPSSLLEAIKIAVKLSQSKGF